MRTLVMALALVLGPLAPCLLAQKPPVKSNSTADAAFPINGVAGGGDDCAAPEIISGLGAFPYSTIGATTGTQGQNNTACNFFGLTGIENDVWFQWTAPAGGTYTVSTCGQTADDTKIALYDVLGCPAVQAIACNDDACDVQSSVTFCATASGQAFTIQLGHFPGSPAGSGTFTIASAGSCLPNDDCATPTAISGTGLFPFDLTNATTGSQGQNNANCNFFGVTGISNDVWFRWAPPTNGNVTVRTCGQSQVDTKIAFYDDTGGTGCPASQALACSDDDCGATLQSMLQASVLSQHEYVLQVGAYPGATLGGGQFEILFTAVCAPAQTYCTAKVSSNFCVATMSAAGLPLLSNPDSYTITASDLEAQRYGLMFFGTTGPDSTPFQGGFMCVAAPLYYLTPRKITAGSAICSGSLSYTLGDLLAHPSGGLTIGLGTNVYCQAYFRDPPGDPSGFSTTGLSGGLRFETCP